MKNGMSIKIATKNYELITIDGKDVYRHRYVVEQFLGRKLTSEEHVHHKDKNTLNNSIDNLQVVSRSEHMSLHGPDRRQQIWQKDSQYLGVIKKKNRPRPWYAVVQIARKTYRTPCFEAEIEAAYAYDKLIERHWPEGKRNFPGKKDIPDSILNKNYGTLRYSWNGVVYTPNDLAKHFGITRSKLAMCLYRGKTLQQIFDSL